MPRTTALLTVLLVPVTALAQETRERDAHVHGISTAEIVVEDGALAIDIVSPGMDIVGFEHEADSDEDRAAVAAAVAAMGRAGDMVAVDPAGGCLLTGAESHLRGEDHGEGDDLDDEEHAHEAAGGEGHSEFHARYAFDCADTDAIRTIAFPFFDAFPNAEEIEVRYVTGRGAGVAELARGSATLTLDE